MTSDEKRYEIKEQIKELIDELRDTLDHNEAVALDEIGVLIDQL